MGIRSRSHDEPTVVRRTVLRTAGGSGAAVAAASGVAVAAAQE